MRLGITSIVREGKLKKDSDQKCCFVMNFSMGEKGQNIKNWTNI
jgi:hypothetical protein